MSKGDRHLPSAGNAGATSAPAFRSIVDGEDTPCWPQDSSRDHGILGSKNSSAAPGTEQPVCAQLLGWATCWKAGFPPSLSSDGDT